MHAIQGNLGLLVTINDAIDGRTAIITVAWDQLTRSSFQYIPTYILDDGQERIEALVWAALQLRCIALDEIREPRAILTVVTHHIIRGTSSAVMT